MRGPIVVVILAICALIGIGGALLIIPRRMTSFLNDAFVIVPKVDGRYPVVRRGIAMLVGVLLISYGAMIRVAHWAEGHQETTLGVLLVRMAGETAQHAGHADIIRELIDGRIGGDEDSVAADSTFWRDRRNRVQEAADCFR